MRKLFISYRSTDAAKVDKIARDLSLLKIDGTPRFTTWQDKINLPGAVPHWWDAIADAIEKSEMFVFHISLGSLQSDVCQAELDYAHELNLPIIPVALEGEFGLGTSSGKYDLDEERWKLIPRWLGERQFLFYNGQSFYSEFQRAVDEFEHKWPIRAYATRPRDPTKKGTQVSNHVLFEQACERAEKLDFKEAREVFQSLLGRNDKDYARYAAEWLEILNRYDELIEIDALPRVRRAQFPLRWAEYLKLFPKEFLAPDEIFDPRAFAAREKPEQFKPVVETITPAALSVALVAPLKPTLPATAILPAPFEWVKIPAGKVTLTEGGYVPKGGPTVPVAAFAIAKYPLTNAQYKLFVDAGGYQEKRWWTEASWKVREEGWHYDKGWKPSGKTWTEPRYWQDATWNGEKQPVVGVSWYEAVAFCRWLNDKTGEKIALPTEQQWQRAAQALPDGRDSGYAYPWGNTWDGKKCNTSVSPEDSNQTTSVLKYADVGAGPCGVVDLAGNVREWCLTAYETGKQDENGTDVRVLRGGSWSDYSSVFFRCDYRNGYSPNGSLDYWGFRLALSL